MHGICNPTKLPTSKPKLTANPQRTYLWIYIILDVIKHLDEFTKGNVERATNGLPETVDEAYNKILNRSSNPLKAQKLLHAVLAAKWPLSLDEMAVILALEPSHKIFDASARNCSQRIVSESH